MAEEITMMEAEDNNTAMVAEEETKSGLSKLKVGGLIVSGIGLVAGATAIGIKKFKGKKDKDEEPKKKPKKKLQWVEVVEDEAPETVEEPTEEETSKETKKKK